MNATTRAVSLLVLLGCPNLSIAADTAEDLLTYRQTVMGSMAKHMKGASMVLRGKVSATGELSSHAKALHAASKNLAHYWPAGSGPETLKTDSLPVIWEKADEWSGAIAAYQSATQTFVEVAETGDLVAAGAQFKKVGASCGGCHKPFRKDDEQ
jgi:cytochrome c556